MSKGETYLFGVKLGSLGVNNGGSKLKNCDEGVCLGKREMKKLEMVIFSKYSTQFSPRHSTQINTTKKEKTRSSIILFTNLAKIQNLGSNNTLFHQPLQGQVNYFGCLLVLCAYIAVLVFIGHETASTWRCRFSKMDVRRRFNGTVWCHDKKGQIDSRYLGIHHKRERVCEGMVVKIEGRRASSKTKHQGPHNSPVG